MDIAIHANPKYTHQIEYAQALQAGFKIHNQPATITDIITLQADVHVVIGPYYAKDYWLNHDHTVLIDCAYYQPDPLYVSAGWMLPSGGRRFAVGEGREKPDIRECTGTKSLFLADYNGPIDYADIIRLHPANKQYDVPLEQILNQCNRASGYETSALVKAALAGLKTTTKSKKHILNNPNWLDLLPYADWGKDEIAKGELWEHLRQSQGQQ